MKKLYSLFLLLTGILCFTSCGDDGYTYTAPETLDVSKTDLYFKSAGGTGSIDINTNQELKVSSSVDWCTVNVSGGKITAKTVENLSIESRAATITVSDGMLTSLIAVYQEGLACTVDTSNFKSANNNSAGSTSVTISSTSPYKITIPEEAKSWLSYTEDDKGKVTFTFAANNTGTFRGAYVVITSGSKKVPVPIVQYEIHDLVGTWMAVYFDGEDYYQEDIKITMPSDGKLDMEFGAIAPTMSPLFHCNYINGAMKVQNATPQGKYGSYYLFSAVLSKEGKVSWITDYTYSGSGTITEDGDFAIAFTNDGSWPGNVINGIAVEAFSSSTPTDASHLGYLLAYFDLTLYKVTP